MVELRAARVELEALKNEKESSAYQRLHLQSNADQNRIRDLENRSVRFCSNFLTAVI